MQHGYYEGKGLTEPIPQVGSVGKWMDILRFCAGEELPAQP